MNNKLRMIFLTVICFMVVAITHGQAICSSQFSSEGKHNGWRYSDSDLFEHPRMEKITLPNGTEGYAAAVHCAIRDAKLHFYITHLRAPISADKHKNGGIKLIYQLPNIPDMYLSVCLLVKKVDEKYEKATVKVKITGEAAGNGWRQAIIPFSAFKMPSNLEISRVIIGHENNIEAAGGKFYVHAISIIDPVPPSTSSGIEPEKTVASSSPQPMQEKNREVQRYSAIFPMAVWFSDKTEKTYYSDEVYESLYQSGFNIIGTPASYPNAPIDHYKLLEAVERFKNTAKALKKYPDMKAYPKIGMGWDIKDPQKKYNRMVWHSGYEQESLVCPADENYWSERVIPVCLEYVKSSLEVPVFAIMLDLELYAHGKFRNVYGLCFCDSCWKYFGTQSGIQLPDLPLKERKTYLDSKDLYFQYREIFYRHITQLVRKLRFETDKINPRLSYWLLPAIDDKLLLEISRGLATGDAPIVISNETTYTKPSPALSDKEGIETNLLQIKKDISLLQREKISFIYLAAIMPTLRASYHARQAIAMAKECDGIWVWDERAVIYQEGRDKFMTLMRVANHEIRQGSLNIPPEWRENDSKKRINIPEGKQGVALSGIVKDNFSQLKNSWLFELESLEDIENTRLTVLQNFNAELPADSPTVKKLRQYVQEGGRLLLTHDTGFFMSSPFPEIVEGSFVPAENGDGRHILDTEMKIAEKCTLAPKFSGKTFIASFDDHAVFKAGPAGEILAYDRYNYPVIICGTFGKGKVIFSGNYYRKLKKDCMETEFVEKLIDWLWE